MEVFLINTFYTKVYFRRTCTNDILCKRYLQESHPLKGASFIIMTNYSINKTKLVLVSHTLETSN